MKYLCFLICLLISTYAFALKANKMAVIEGDAHLNGRPQKSTPAVVDYQGPCGTKRPTSVRMWKDRVLDVTAWLTSSDGGNAEPAGVEFITSWRCDFWPRLIVVKPGTDIRVVNEDPTSEWVVVSVNGVEKKQVLQKSGGEPILLKVKDGEIIELTSGFHKWMKARILPAKDVVFSTSTDLNGQFIFKNVRPGKYILHTWHPLLGETSRDITIKSKEYVTVKVSYELPESQPPPVIKSSMLKEFLVGPKEPEEDPFVTRRK